jgi:hypothetical protein
MNCMDVRTLNQRWIKDGYLLLRSLLLRHLIFFFLIQKKPIRWNFKQKGKLIYNRIFNQAQEGGITIKFWWLNFEEA